jgi:hypothetical protein
MTYLSLRRNDDDVKSMRIDLMMVVDENENEWRGWESAESLWVSLAGREISDIDCISYWDVND